LKRFEGIFASFESQKCVSLGNLASRARVFDAGTRVVLPVFPTRDLPEICARK